MSKRSSTQTCWLRPLPDRCLISCCNDLRRAPHRLHTLARDSGHGALGRPTAWHEWLVPHCNRRRYHLLPSGPLRASHCRRSYAKTLGADSECERATAVTAATWFLDPLQVTDPLTPTRGYCLIFRSHAWPTVSPSKETDRWARTNSLST
jgi:hypothetical protein